MKAKRTKLSDQLRQLLDNGPRTRYRIAKETGVDTATLSRFMHGKGGLSTAALDRIADCLGLSFTTESPPPAPKKPKGK